MKKHFIILIIILFSLCNSLYSQIGNVLKGSQILIAPIVKNNIDSANGYGYLRIIGWSPENYIAYSFDPFTVIAGDSEPRFFIYNLNANEEVYSELIPNAYDTLYSNPDSNRRLIAFNRKMDSLSISYSSQKELTPVNDITIDSGEDLIKVEYKKELIKEIEVGHSANQFSHILFPIGALTSPFDEDLKVAVFPAGREVEAVLLLAINTNPNRIDE